MAVTCKLEVPRCVVAISLVIVTHFLKNSVSAADAPQIRAARDIKNSSMGNYFLIQTWQGSMSTKERNYLRGERSDTFLKDFNVDPSGHTKGVLLELNVKVTFVCDMAKGQLYYKSKQSEPKVIDLANDSVIKVKGLAGVDFVQVITESEYMYINTSILDTEEKVKVARIVPVAQMREQPAFHDFWDPRKMFNPVRNEPVWELIELAARRFERHPEMVVESVDLTSDKSQWAIEQVATDPNHYVLRALTILPDGKRVRHEITFDSASAFNWTRVEEWHGQTRTYLSEASYEMVSGVTLPKRFAFTKWSSDGQLDMEYEAEIDESNPYAKVPTAKFTVHALGLQDGEKVWDEIRNCRFEYRQGRLLESATAPAQE